MQREVRFGTAELLADADGADAWLLTVDGVAQSYVDLGDPTHLEFDYVQLLGEVVDQLPPGPLAAVHLGGGGCTLPRFVASVRPGSRQVVLEADDLLADLVRSALGTEGFRLRVADARDGLAALQPGQADLVVADVFAGSRLPVHCTTVEHVDEVRRVLRPGGTYAVNVGDGKGLAFTRGQVATLAARFDHVLLMADPGVLRGRRFGNLVLAASDDPLPVAALTRRTAGRARVVDGDDLVRFTAGARPVTDATAREAPQPPPDVFSRR